MVVKTMLWMLILNIMRMIRVLLKAYQLFKRRFLKRMLMKIKGREKRKEKVKGRAKVKVRGKVKVIKKGKEKVKGRARLGDQQNNHRG